MKKTILLSLSFIICQLSFSVAQAQRKTCIDRDWLFFYGDGSAALNADFVAAY